MAGNCFVSSTLGGPILFAFGRVLSYENTAPFASSMLLRFNRQYRHPAKTRATHPWYRRCHLAIHGKATANLDPQIASAGIPAIRLFFNGLTQCWRPTYSASGQYFPPGSAGCLPPGRGRSITTNRASKSVVKIEDRFDEMAKGTFGERLKRERELREVTVHEIASATRIAAKFLEALENEQWEKLPGGVFGRGFVRSIATLSWIERRKSALRIRFWPEANPLRPHRKSQRSEFPQRLSGFLR